MSRKVSLGGFQVGPGMWVRLRYAAFDEDGEPVEEMSSQTEYVHGFGALLPRLEAALEGQTEGARRELTLSPREAFGPRRKDSILELDPSEFPPDVAPGDRFDAENDDGGLVVLRVLEVQPDLVVVDTNHPLAGQRVRFELEVEAVRPATEAELTLAEPVEAADGPVLNALIPAERLLRGPSERYEMGRSEPGATDDGPDDEN